MTKYLREMFSVKLPIIKGGVTIHDIFYPGDEFGDWFNEELFLKQARIFLVLGQFSLKRTKTQGRPTCFSREVPKKLRN